MRGSVMGHNAKARHRAKRKLVPYFGGVASASCRAMFVIRLERLGQKAARLRDRVDTRALDAAIELDELATAAVELQKEMLDGLPVEVGKARARKLQTILDGARHDPEGTP